MRIAHVSPLAESVPPRTYGGTERVVSWLVETMTGMGHDVTLFASADSVTSATLRPCSPVGLRTDPECRDPLAYDIRMMNRVLAEAQSFDVIHFHTNLLQFALFRDHPTPCVTTLHGRPDLPELKLFLDEFPEMPLVSVSGAQRRPLAVANWVGTVHHGVPETLLGQGRGEGGYLAFLGRFSPEKRADAAIRIAQRTGLPLKLAAKVDRADVAYFESTIRPLLTLPGIEYVGEIAEHEKEEFLGQARALLFPICWPEPFGLVMIEAMACGTPVIAFPFGSVPEVIDDGRTGYIVPDEDAAVKAVAWLDRLDRTQIRCTFERRFSARRMAAEYIQIYESLLAERRPRAAPRRLDDELENA
jgi:glycosyltransferase involved in cell wall biosynthesis